MNASHDASLVALAVRPLLANGPISLPDEYRYAHLSLALIDAIYSLNARYESVRGTVLRYARHAKLTPYRPVIGEWTPAPAQQPLSAFIQDYETTGLSPMVTDVFQNRQRTSPHNGILKGEAVLEAARLLAQYGVAYFQDVPHIMSNAAFEADFKAIRGQGSGLSLAYFWMLTGTDDLAKPDRQITRYLCRALDRSALLPDEATQLLQGAVELLRPEFPELTTRALDFAIWQHERSRSKSPDGAGK